MQLLAVYAKKCQYFETVSNADRNCYIIRFSNTVPTNAAGNHAPNLALFLCVLSKNLHNLWKTIKSYEKLIRSLQN